MKYVLTADQMKRADERMIRDMGIPSLVLMERAALRCYQEIRNRCCKIDSVLVVCGSGNNGGDGFAIARLFYEEQTPVDVVFVGNRGSRSEETKTQMKILENLGVSIQTEFQEKEYDVVVDAVFGIGLCRTVEGRYRDVIERMNSYQGYKVAVDIASGISADTGEILGCAFQADLTVTFAYAKLGQLLHPGSAYTGSLEVTQIGIWNPDFDRESDLYYHFEDSDIARKMPRRKPDSNKGTYGKVLVIAGSKGMSGAAFLAAKAAYLTGAGLVRIYTEESNRQILQQLIPEAIMTTYEAESEEPLKELKDAIDWAEVICIGCGLGMSDLSRRLLHSVLECCGKPCVIDADGLNILAESEERCWKQLGSNCVLTPHMKEMSRLVKRTVGEIKAKKGEILEAYKELYAPIMVLKDSRTLVAGRGKQTYLNVSGNAAMAKAGAGDVLTGVIAGLMAQGLEAYDAAVLGVYLHGRGGDAARQSCGAYSVLAQNIMDGVKETLKRMEY